MRNEDNKTTYITTTLPPSDVLLFFGACRGRVEGCFLGRGCGVVAAGFGVFGWFGLEGVFVLGAFGSWRTEAIFAGDVGAGMKPHDVGRVVRIRC